jgi:serine/threonine protein kinase
MESTESEKSKPESTLDKSFLEYQYGILAGVPERKLLEGLRQRYPGDWNDLLELIEIHRLVVPSRLPLESLPAPFGGFLLMSVLGKGGMGVVYEASQESLNRTVAIKLILRGDFASIEIEARTAARLKHPHIVGVYDVGVIDGHPFFSMEYLEGGTLKDRLCCVA